MNDVEYRPVIVTSLIRELTLPKNPLINPFYDPEFELLRNHHQRQRRSMDSLNITDTDVDDLTERSTIDSTWENLMVNGPTAVNLFGQIMVLSSKLDFSFREANPNQIFIYIKYPDSFRATLTQISNGKFFFSSLNSSRFSSQKLGMHFSSLILTWIDFN